MIFGRGRGAGWTPGCRRERIKACPRCARVNADRRVSAVGVVEIIGSRDDATQHGRRGGPVRGGTLMGAPATVIDRG